MKMIKQKDNLRDEDGSRNDDDLKYEDGSKNGDSIKEATAYGQSFLDSPY